MIVNVLVRRVVSLVATLLVASVLIFASINVLPGDPAEVMLGTDARPDTLAALRQEMGFDRPLFLRYLEWVTGFFTGNLGVSHTYSVPVMDLVRERLPLSLPLAGASLILAILIGLPLGIYAAIRRGQKEDRLVLGGSQILIAIPNVWLAMILVLIFAMTLRVLPSGGFSGWSQGIWSGIRALVLPALALSLPQAAILARVMRSSLLEALDETFVRAARARGLSGFATLINHAIPNALNPVFTILGLQASFLLAGTIVIETVFSLPGLGRLILQAINQRDIIVVQSLSMMLVAMVIFVNFLVDLAMLIQDPRLRRREAL
jgi:peptide/nickel transport system permease protein